MTAPTTIREYDISARSTPVFGRVMCSARNHHFIVDGPVQNPALPVSAAQAGAVTVEHALASAGELSFAVL